MLLSSLACASLLLGTWEDNAFLLFDLSGHAISFSQAHVTGSHVYCGWNHSRANAYFSMLSFPLL